MRIETYMLDGSWDGWVPIRWNGCEGHSRPTHGGQVIVAFFIGENGPFVSTSRYESGDWDMQRENPGVVIYAWREPMKAPKAQVLA